MKSGLENMVAYIKEKGLPSVEQMRAYLEQQESEKRQELQDGQSALEAKLPEYKELFERFKAGEDLTKGEVRRMTDLSQEFQKFADDTGQTL